MAELLADTSLTPRQREYVASIRTSGENLFMLVSDAVDWARLESGQLEVQRSDFDLQQTLADAIEPVHAQAEEKNIELVLEVTAEVPPRVNGDAARLRQVLCNLLAHAVRQTPRGDVVLRVRVDEDQLRFEVADSAPPLPRERLLRLYEQAGEERTGSGFGLVIAAQLVRHMGGRTGAEPQEHGNLLWCSLPLPAAADAPVVDVAELAGLRVLVVDDNKASRRVIEQMAGNWGMQVITAESGQEGLALARTQSNLGNSFDIAIVDHNMPGMSGLQLAARIKEDPLIRSDVLIIMLTGLSIAPTDTMARNAGISRVLTKPVAGMQLQTVLREELARRSERLGGESADNDQPLPADMRVLVAEDHHLSQKVIRGMLNKLGLKPDTASNGEEALQALKQNRYDLVLMDCEMPVVDGYEATRRLRALEREQGNRRLPVLALSAHILNDVKERCREAGMDGHLAKPVDLAELRNTLRIYAARP
jgi:CheY-like chemotaxis protein